MSARTVPALILASLLACASLTVVTATRAGGTAATTPQPVAITPDALDWKQPTGSDAIQASWVIGDLTTDQAYLQRVKLAKDARIAPHTHPDTRHSTVLKGSLWVGFGERFDPYSMVRIPEHGVYIAPAGVAHFIWARDEPVLYQESGQGPSGMNFVEQGLRPQ